MNYKDEERSWHIMRKQDWWKGGYNILGDQASQEIVKSTHALKDTQVGNFVNMVISDEWWRMKKKYLDLLLK